MPNIKVEPTIPNYPPQGIQAQLDLLYLWNPDVANDLIEQLNKVLEEVAADLSAYLTKAEAADTYATQQEVTALSGAVEEVSNKADTLDNDLKELGDQTAGIQQDVNTLKTDVADKVSKAGDTMTGSLFYENARGEKMIFGRFRDIFPTAAEPYRERLVIGTSTTYLNFLTGSIEPGISGGYKVDLGSHYVGFDTIYALKISNGVLGGTLTIPEDAVGTITLNEVNFQSPVTDDNKGATMAELAGMQPALTAEQLAAVNSGITAEHVTTYDSYAAEISQAQNDATKAENAAEVAQQTANLAGQEAAQALTQLAGKQATLTEPQLNAVNSGITADKVSTYDGYQTDLTTLDGDMTDLGNQVTEIQQNINTLNTTVSEKADTADLPQNQTGTTGQVYTKTATGGAWQDATQAIATAADNIITEELGNNIVRVSGQENFGTLAQQATTEHPITLPLTMANTTYSVVATAASTGGMAEINCGISAVTTTGFTLGVRNLDETAEAAGVIVSWVVTGQKV